MAQTGYTPIQLYHSTTPGNTPLAADLAPGELAINTADGKLFYEDSGGAVQTIAYKNVPLNTVTGTLATANGGTGNTNGTVAKLATTNFSIEESGGKLLFKYGATTIGSLSSAGVFTALSDVVSNGTP